MIARASGTASWTAYPKAAKFVGVVNRQTVNRQTGATRRAGVGTGTAYRHFPTREALFRAIVASRLQRLIDSATPLLEADDPGAAFFAFLALLVEEGEKDRAWSRRWLASGSTSRR